MRKLILVLAALNLVALAWWQGWLDDLVGSAREPARLAMQIEPDRVRVVADPSPVASRSPVDAVAPATVAGGPRPSRATGAPPAPGTSVAPAVPAGNGERVSAARAPLVERGVPVERAPVERAPVLARLAVTERPTEPAPVSGERTSVAAPKPREPATIAQAGASARIAPQPVLACVQFSPLEQSRVADFGAALEAGGARVERGRVENTSGYVVYIAPLPSVRDAQRRVQELKDLGVRERDIYLLPDGPYRQGIALGVFRAEDSARTQLRQLEARGVEGAQIGFVNPAATRVVLRARGPIDRLAELAAREAAAAGLSVAPCD